jgi:hypothetical protein
MPQKGDVVEFEATRSYLHSWVCVMSEEVQKIHANEIVRVILGRSHEGGGFKKCECLKHPNHFGDISATRPLTVVVAAAGTN